MPFRTWSRAGVPFHGRAAFAFFLALALALKRGCAVPALQRAWAVLTVLFCTLVPVASQAQANGAAVYQAKCSLCHDSGAGAAPRISHPEEWTARLAQSRAALHNAAVLGKQGTAMAPKGGYAELSEPEVKAAVDFMLARLDYKEGVAAVAGPASSSAITSAATPATAAAPATTLAAPGLPVDDAAIAEKIRAAYAASNGAVSTRVQIESRGGTVTLRGMVRDNQALKRAEDLARAVPGVKNVDNKLVSAAVFQWD